VENQASKPTLGLENETSRPLARDVLLKAARETAAKPGVYLMKDPGEVILYVGKAKNLPSRLTSYFQKFPHEIPRIEMLVSRIHHFDVILTETESEALILECTLIKKHKPKFNIRLKDDKTYPYLKIQVDKAYPRIEWTRKVTKDGARYFGPFPSAWSARQVMSLLNNSFKLRDCSDNTFAHRSRPCILHQMEKCSAPCVKLVTENEYKESIGQVVEVLEGKTDELIETLKLGMEDAASREEFEVAADYRDQIQGLTLVTATQGVSEADIHRNRDVVGIARKGVDGHGAILQIRAGKMVAVRHYNLQNTDPSVPEAEVLAEFIEQYYAACELTEELMPPEVLLPFAPTEPEVLKDAFGITAKVADGVVDEQLVNVARSNAEYALEQMQKKAAGHGLQALEEVQDKLHLLKLPHRIECFDNSNIQGEDAVASRVVFIDGAPDKNLYRRYKIKTVEGANDFASMKEILDRRFSNKEEELPDLVVVDGGKGQLSQAVAIMEELGIQGVGVVGLAKARTESDFQSKEVKSSFERIFIPGRKNPVNLLPHTSAYKLLTHVRDEAHRFAITYHRLLRSKRTLRSED